MPLVLLFLLPSVAAPAQPNESAEYLSDHPELIFSAEQAWGELGLNTAAHAKGIPGTPLIVGDRTFQKGLGHHANGSITVLLEGLFVSFDAEVGLQPCGGDGGTVVFKAFVDGGEVFNSGIMLVTNGPRPVHLEVRGASELRLEAADAGDGITCDMANWGDARLTRSTGAVSHVPPERVDIAPFGRVITCDPNRKDGARSTRLQEYRVEDIYLEKPLSRSRDGLFHAPLSTNGLACVGLQWLNRRAIVELQLFCAHLSALPATDSIRVEAWQGESAWQGTWTSIPGSIMVTNGALVFQLDGKAGFLQTQKVRWVIPCRAGPRVRKLSAYTRSRWETVPLIVEEDTGRGRIKVRIGVAVENGGLAGVKNVKRVKNVKTLNREALNRETLERGTPPDVGAYNWDGRGALRVVVRASRTGGIRSDPTVLRFKTEAGSVGVAVEDVLREGRVFLPEIGLSVSRDPAPVSLPEYKQELTRTKTILQEVKGLPDQTFEQAMARTHHEAQHEGPVMLSLSCENLKFVLEREGTLRFPSSTNAAADWMANAGEIRSRFGSGRAAFVRRELEGGWLPVPIITFQNDGVEYRQRTFVAPAGLSDAGRHPRPSVCVIEYVMSNTLAVAADSSVTLELLLNTAKHEPGEFGLAGEVNRLGSAGLFCSVLSPGSLSFRPERGAGKVSVRLAPGASARFALLLTDEQVNPARDADAVAGLRREVQSYWETILAPATQITTPDPLLNNVIRSSQVRCLIAARNEAGGERIAPWIAAMSYGPLESEAHSVIRGMDFMGHEEFARRGLDFFIHRYNTNGFLTTGYTTFGTAWHLWTLGEHQKIYRDTNWLCGIAPELARAGDWIVRQTEKTRRETGPPAPRSAEGFWRNDGHSPEYGLMPPGVLADWNAFAYHYAMNGYYYAALHELGDVFAELASSERGKRELYLRRSRELRKAAAELRGNVLKAYRWTQAQAPALKLRNGAWIPHYPSQLHSPGKLAEFFPGQDAGRSWCYDVELGAHQLVPTGIFQPRDAEVNRMLDHMEDVQFLASGWFDYTAQDNERDWFNLGGFSKVQPYYTRNCEIYAMRDEIKPFVRSYFNTLAAMLNPEVLTLWEHFNHSGAWDKTHETGYFLHQTRTMLVTERGRELWLAPLVTSNWFGNGMVIAVSNAPTRFGRVSYRIESADDRVEAVIEPPGREAPEWIVLRVRHPSGKPIGSVTVNGRRYSRFDAVTGVVRLKGKGTMRVMVGF